MIELLKIGLLLMLCCVKPILDIDTVIFSHNQRFADDCKMYRSVPSATDIATLQQDINNLCQWSMDWQMVFNVKKKNAMCFI